VKILRLLAALVVAAIALTGCTATAGAPGTTAAGAASSSGALAETLDADAFAALVATPGVVVLDVRTPEEFAQGHLEGALNIDVSAPDFADRVGELDRAATYAVYCRSGNRSATALAEMAALGFTDAHHLAGGIGAWQRAGHPVVS